MAYPISGASPFVQAGDDLNMFLRGFWKRQIQSAEHDPVDVRHPALPLARIKKVMKSDPEIKHMISADAPVLFCKACEIFIEEVTARAFLNADACKRRTINKSDVARALARSDQFDFLIDIVPREDPNSNVPSHHPHTNGNSAGAHHAPQKRKSTSEHAANPAPSQRTPQVPPPPMVQHQMSQDMSMSQPHLAGPAHGRSTQLSLSSEASEDSSPADSEHASNPMALDHFLSPTSHDSAMLSPQTNPGHESSLITGNGSSPHPLPAGSGYPHTAHNA